MIVKPKVRGFVCVTSHPAGCDANIKEQIDYVSSQAAVNDGPKKVLVLGGSTGYGLSSRIVATFGCKADTLGVFFERPSSNGRPASAGWYNTAAFEKYAREAGVYAKSINGDAFSNEIKDQTIAELKNGIGAVDLVIYSLAAPRRTDPATGDVYKSTLKPIGDTFTGKTVNTDKHEVHEVSIDPATEDDITATEKVMGGEDWELWIDALAKEGLLADGCKTIAYSYIGPEVTWPIYTNGTIGNAKKHLDKTAIALNEKMKSVNGSAYVSVNKAVVTQASSAIPIVPLYTSLLIKIMKEKGTNEGCTEQIYRLFAERLYNGSDLQLDDESRIRIDDLEMREEVQEAVKKVWPDLSTETLYELTDYDAYGKEFLKLFGFGVEGVNYDEESEIEVDLV